MGGEWWFGAFYTNGHKFGRITNVTPAKAGVHLLPDVFAKIVIDGYRRAPV